MKELNLAILLFVAPTMAAAEIREIEQKILNDWDLSTMSSYFDTVSEQYCLLVVDPKHSILDCKPIHKFSERAQRNILGNNYVPKSCAGESRVSKDHCHKN
ncbi:hypothetical protein [Endozoicomonas sp. 8E]|uniref:hypothetical protein n=1 Tax=Endozoicomonas sp. 8E TaxID=3035692 RepID=UPI002938D682|nr:hypothetical protein [Endozoicomonas sp. 8E]WOG29457.1 hypothetical protein P6910_07355 [Endozoicomonas sp. 8E]